MWKIWEIMEDKVVFQQFFLFVEQSPIVCVPLPLTFEHHAFANYLKQTCLDQLKILMSPAFLCDTWMCFVKRCSSYTLANNNCDNFIWIGLSLQFVSILMLHNASRSVSWMKVLLLVRSKLRILISIFQCAFDVCNVLLCLHLET